MTRRPRDPGPDAPGDPANPPPQGGRKAPRSAATGTTAPDCGTGSAPPSERPGTAPVQGPPRNAYERRQRAIQDKRKAQARAAYTLRMERKAIQAERKRQLMLDAIQHEQDMDAPQD